MIRRFPVILSILALLIIAGESFAKSFDGAESHSKDFCECLGVNCNSSASPYNAFKEISGLIDNVSANGFYKNLKKNYGFKWEKGKSHRILFHWGFNEHPKSSEALRKRVEETVKKSKQGKFYEFKLLFQKPADKTRLIGVKEQTQPAGN